jgi:hypothetical protein
LKKFSRGPTSRRIIGVPNWNQLPSSGIFACSCLSCKCGLLSVLLGIEESCMSIFVFELLQCLCFSTVEILECVFVFISVHVARFFIHSLVWFMLYVFRFGINSKFWSKKHIKIPDQAWMLLLPPSSIIRRLGQEI